MPAVRHTPDGAIMTLFTASLSIYLGVSLLQHGNDLGLDKLRLLHETFRLEKMPESSIYELSADWGSLRMDRK